MKCTFAKLKDGNWGIRIQTLSQGEKPTEGTRVKVEKKSGETEEKTLGGHVWSDAAGKTHIFRIQDDPKDDAKDDAKGRRGERYVCAECGKGGKLVADLEDGLMKHYRCCDIPPGGY